MVDTLPVRLNDEGLYDVSAASEFETAGSFALRLENHGSPAHVHVRLDDALAAVATLPETTVYVDEDDVETLSVDVSGPARGLLTVTTGHGAESASVDVSLVERSEPATATTRTGTTSMDGEAATTPASGDVSLPGAELPRAVVAAGALLALGAVAVLGTVLARGSDPTLVLGAGALSAALAVAAYLLVRSPE